MGQRQADCCTFRDILQADAKAQRQCTADGIRLPGQCQCSGKARHHTLGQVVQCYSQHHTSAVPGPACQQLPGKLFHLQKAHCAQHKPHCRWDPCRKRQSLSALDSRQQQAPHTGRQHDARCHAAQDALRAGPRPPPQQKHACCPQCSARRREQQYPRSENDLVHDTFPLCPVYVRRSKKVQKSPSHKIQCDGLFCQNAIASSSLPKGRPVAGSTGGRPACLISAAFTLHTTALASTYFTFAVAAAPILS